ncbi:MAG TPA: hypothetical protein VIH96_15875, partial [Paraburkholderia sp.]
AKPAAIGFAADFQVLFRGWIATIGLIRILSMLLPVSPAYRFFESGFKLELTNLKCALTADLCAPYMAHCCRFIKLKISDPK